ncbi:MAG: TolB-like protein [Acidimicrobiales bacterium]|nr:TolB-like protein [Acidimicrobiales bacterium]
MPSPLLRTAIAAAALTVAAVLPATQASAVSIKTIEMTTRAVDSNGVQYATGTATPKLSANGLWLAFSRPGGGTYIKSLLSGAVTLVSVNQAHTAANKPSTVVGINTTGTQIVFETTATNMGEGAATADDLYLRNLDLDSTTRLNYLPASFTPTAAKPGESTMADGGLIAFTSAANRIYLRSPADGTSEQVDVSSAEVSGNGGSKEPSVSNDGRYVTFTSSGDNLVTGDTNFVADVFRRDRQTGTTVRVSLGAASAQLQLGSRESSVSNDGRYVAFTSDAPNAVVNDTNTDADIFRRDVMLGVTQRVNLANNLAQALGDSSHPDISTDGGRVVFESKAENLDTSAVKNGKPDIFERDLAGGTTKQFGLVGAAPGQAPNQGTSEPSFSSATGDVAFVSASNNVVQNDSNSASDVFVERTEILGPFNTFQEFLDRQELDFGDSPYPNEYTTVTELKFGKLTPSHMIVTLAKVPAYAQDLAPVARLYQAFFHREPDFNGLNFWVKRHATGTKLSKVAASFAGSSEFKTAYGTLDGTDFVGLVYGNVLQRKPDPAGLAHWVKKLADGMSRGDLMVAFSESSEGKRFLAPEVDATVIGVGMYHGMPPKVVWEQAAAAERYIHEPEWVAVTYLQDPTYLSVASA